MLSVRGTSGVSLLGSRVRAILTVTNGAIAGQRCDNVGVLRVHSPSAHSVFCYTFMSGRFITSCASKLIRSTVSSHDGPGVKLSRTFVRTRGLISNGKLVQIFMGCTRLPRFVGVCLKTGGRCISVFDGSVGFTKLFFGASGSQVRIGKCAFQGSATSPCIATLLGSKGRGVGTRRVLSKQATLCAGVNFGGPIAFIRRLRGTLSLRSGRLCDSCRDSHGGVRKLFNVSLRRGFLD